MFPLGISGNSTNLEVPTPPSLISMYHNLFNLLYFPEVLPFRRANLKVLPSGICEYSEIGDSGINWTTVASSQLVKNTAHIIEAFTLTPLVLPATNLALGDRIIIVDQGGAGFQINQSAGEQIRYGTRQTTVGITGKIVSNEIGNAIELVFLGGIWVAAPGSIGNFDVI